MKPGKRNLITDVEGLRVGNAHDRDLRSGVTIILPDARVICAVDSRGGGPGTRETDALDPANLVDEIDAIVLSGGSVFGLDAASSVTAWLAQHGRGFFVTNDVPPSPVVPAAILYDLNNGGDKSWAHHPPYHGLGIEAVNNARHDFTLGNRGAGHGAVAGTLKGGLGSASIILGEDFTIGALFAVNSFGSALVPGTSRFWAQPFCLELELGERRKDAPGSGADLGNLEAGTKAQGLAPGHNTTIGVVATDAILTPAEARRIAIMAQDGLARALRPVHTPFDGDTVFVLATGKKELGANRAYDLMRIGAAAADVSARAIARGIYQAETLGAIKSYREIWG